jgi:RNA recognition motif-containing protein
VPPVNTRRGNAAPAAAPESHANGTTTFMLRNIPNRVKVEDIQDRICALGFGDAFDFLYMPLDLQSKQNKGYAFVNLINEREAEAFAERFNGAKFEGRLSSKEVQVCKATAQGVLPTLYTIKHSNWSKKEHMPIVRVEGKLMYLTPLAACEILRIKEHYG